MKSTDFRIGNFAQDQNGNLLKVYSLTEEHVYYFVVDRSKFPLPEGWKAEPIPITKDWLRKLGFSNKYSENCYIVDFGGNNEFFVFNSETPVAKANDVKPGEFYTTWTSKSCIRVIKNVHDLQNLFYAWSEGRELEFSDNQ